ncbi:hypothetical protein [Limosilactobacillus caecicola]|uniref:hypothetical protein n=1 Tax=Limosilactobacillus caecicola TaxID=2941332 RepID=UPI00203DFD09|nr:hypothetical protein [Limosilactobacillus caecicola]
MNEQEWFENIKNQSQQLADQLVRLAKTNAKTYADAKRYIKRIKQTMSYGTVEDSQTNAAFKINEAICNLALHQIWEEQDQIDV